MYTRRSRTPPKDGVPKADLPPVISHEERNDDVPSSHEAQSEPGESKEVEDHQDTEGEEFHEGDLYSAKAEVEKVMQTLLVVYVELPTEIEEIKSPPREEEAEKISSPERREEHVEEKQSRMDETLGKQGLSEEVPKD